MIKKPQKKKNQENVTVKTEEKNIFQKTNGEKKWTKYLEIWLPIIISFIGIAISLYQFKRTVKDSQMEREIRVKEGEPLLVIQKSSFTYDTTNFVFVPAITNIGKREAKNVIMKCLILAGDEMCNNLKYVDSVSYSAYNPITPGQSVEFITSEFDILDSAKKYFIIKLTSNDILAAEILEILDVENYDKSISHEYFFIERHPEQKNNVYKPQIFSLENELVSKLKLNPIVSSFLKN